MQINAINNYNQNFKAVQLTKAEEIKARRLIDKITSSEFSPQYNDLCISDLFGIFDKHILKEAKSKIKPFHIEDDFIQEIYLQFFVTLQNLKKYFDPFYEILSSINNFKPSQYAYKPEYTSISLNKSVFSDSEKVKKMDMLTEDDLPSYSKASSEEENQKNVNNLNLAVSAANLTNRQLEIFNMLRKGGQQKDIAKFLGISEGNISKSKKMSIAKIQQANGVLPKEYYELADEFKNRFQTDIPDDKIITAIIKGELITLDKSILYKRIQESSKILGISEQEFFKIGTGYTILFHISPDVLRNNIQKCANAIGISEEKYKSMIVKHPVLCSSNPETILNNIKESSKVIGISEEKFKECVIKHPPLIGQTAQTLSKNIKESSEKIGVTKDEFIKFCMKYPTLFSRVPDSLGSRIKDYSGILNLTKENTLKYISKNPSLLTQRPETIQANIKKSSELLGISEEQFIKCAKSAPSILYMSPQTLKRNVTESSKMLSVSEERFLKCAINTPTLFIRKPESLKACVDKISELSKVKVENVIETAMNNGNILCIKPENVLTKHSILNYYKRLQGKSDNEKLYCGSEKDETWYTRMLAFLVSKEDKSKIVRALKPAENLTNYLKNRPDKEYLFEIPPDNAAEDFIKFAEDFSLKTLGKNIFKFKIARAE